MITLDNFVKEVRNCLCRINQILGQGTVTDNDASTGIVFSGSGTEADPLTAEVTGGSGITEVTYNNGGSTGITFSGSGTSGDPLTAAVSGGGVPSLADVTQTGGNNTFSATLTQQGTYSYRVWGGNVSFYDSTGATLGGTISGVTANQLNITGGSAGILMPSTVTIQGTASQLVVNASTGGVISTQYSAAGTAVARVGISANNLVLTALNAAGSITLTPGASGSVSFPLTGLAAGTNVAIAATDTILVALAKLQAQIDAIP